VARLLRLRRQDWQSIDVENVETVEGSHSSSRAWIDDISERNGRGKFLRKVWRRTKAEGDLGRVRPQHKRVSIATLPFGGTNPKGPRTAVDQILERSLKPAEKTGGVCPLRGDYNKAVNTTRISGGKYRRRAN